MTEVFFRNPSGTPQEMIARGVYNASWDESPLDRRNIDVVSYMKVNFIGVDWRALVIGPSKGAMLYTPKSKYADEPAETYPVWNRYHYDLDDLKLMVQYPWHKYRKLYDVEELPYRYQPPLGVEQDHIVVINDPPNLGTAEGQNYYIQLREVLKTKAPDCKVFIHGTRSFRLLFGDEVFWAGSVDVGELANRKSVVIPTGTVISKDDLDRETHQMWVNALGYSLPKLMSDWRTRLEFSMDATLWAQSNYRSTIDFAVRVKRGEERPDIDTPGRLYDNVPTVKRRTISRSKFLAGDGIICNGCSLVASCKYAREGAVCAMPSREMSELAKSFGTRDSSVIIDSLGKLLGIQTQRLEKAIEAEEKGDDLDPEVSKQLNSVFANGTKLAQLIDPKLKGNGTTVNVLNAGQVNAAVPLQGNPQAFIANAVRELEARGFAREDITTEMIQGLLTGMADRGIAERVIEHEAREITDGR